MQNKGFIRVFSILLVAAAAYSLSFTYFTWKANNDADKYAKGDKHKREVFMDSLAQKDDYYNFLGLRKFSLGDCQNHELNLGLDLKGGMNVTLQISVKEMIINLSNEGLEDTMLAKTIARAEFLERSSGEDFVVTFGKAFNQLYPNKYLRTMFIANEDISTKITFNSTNEEVLSVLAAEEKAAIDNSFNVIRTRIDRFGVTQPNIQNIGNGRILVELPGVKDQERVRDLLESSAILEFWETYDCKDVIQVLFDANKTLAALNATKTVVKDTTKTADASAKDSTKAKPKKELSLKEQLKQDTTKVAKADSTKSQEEIERENPLISRLIPNISQDGRPGLGPVVGFAQKNDLAIIDSLLKTPEVKAAIEQNAPELKLAWSKKEEQNGLYTLIALKDIDRDGKPSLDGSVVVDSRPDFSETGGAASVRMVMNNDGAKEWRRLTKENIEKSVAIVLDGYVYSYPTVQTEIADGISSITGNFTIPEATDLANILKSGKLSTPAHIIEEAIVGPSLGKESINAGMLSFIVAFLLVLLFMILYYAKGGLVANVALFVNVFLIFGVLASLGAVLTLPGIAGIVITLGMAVDQNIIIYERIREELEAGKGIKLAVADGFKHAMSAIVDGSLTTIITGIILYIFGTGPIQGFATTLVIGILTSLFTAIFISRLVFERMLSKKKNVTFGNRISNKIFKHVDWKIIQQRYKMYIFSGIIIGVGVISIFVRGFNYGVDFKGGRSYIVRFDEKVETEKIQSALKLVFNNNAPDVKSYGEDNEVKITTKYLIEDQTAKNDSIVEHKLYEGLIPIIGKDVTFEKFSTDYKIKSQKVGPTIADDIIWGSVLAVFFSLIGIFLYIFVRFKSWIYGLGGVLSLFHDVLFVLGWYSLLWGFLPFSMEIDQAFIAAILTVVGYSINDTVIVYDRVREYKSLYPKRDNLSLFNGAINSTFGRTINTVFTVMITLTAIFLFGGEMIRGFIFAMLIGVGVGTYSSIFIASAIVYDTMEWKNKKDAKKLK